MKRLDWYFDFVSPYAYLQSARLPELARHADVRCVPVLFAGLLAHWETKGPAEVVAKRRWTFDQVAWLAHRHAIPLVLPREHPFVPLRLLRLSIVLGNRPETVRRLFAFVWQEGKLPTDEEPFDALLAECGVDPSALESAQVKQALRSNTEAAIAAGVFGVPSSVVEGQVFWGFDATEMVLAYLAGDPFFGSPQLAAARALRDGVHRRATQSPRA